MATTQAILPKGRGSRDRLCAFIQSLPEGKAWRVEIGEHKLTRTAQQNTYLWGKVYEVICASLGYRGEDDLQANERGDIKVQA